MFFDRTIAFDAGNVAANRLKGTFGNSNATIGNAAVAFSGSITTLERSNAMPRDFKLTFGGANVSLAASMLLLPASMRRSGA